MEFHLQSLYWVRSNLRIKLIICAAVLLPIFFLFRSHRWERAWDIAWPQKPLPGVYITSSGEFPSRDNDNLDVARGWDSFNYINKTELFHNTSQSATVRQNASKDTSDNSRRWDLFIDQNRTTRPHDPSRNATLKTNSPVTEPRTQSVPFAISSSFPLVSKHTKAIGNLRKLEAGLQRARVSLRLVALENYNVSEFDVHLLESKKEPFGLAYRNAAIFRRSYIEMEKRFKIFVYPEGEEPMVHSGPCKDIYAIEGRFMREFQSKSPFVTTDPEKAHAFFLPFSLSKMVTYLFSRLSWDRTPLLHFVRDYVDVVAANYPFWNRSQGADHFMLTCHDWGPAVSTAHPNLKRNGIRVLCNANTSEGFVPMKDASLPELNLLGGVFPAAIGGPPADKRAHLAFFAGANHGPVRPKLFEYWEGKDDDVLVFSKLPKKYSYHHLMKNSKYCICPGGYEVNSPRIVEAIYNECVPVILADGFVLPFSDVLNWNAFSLHLPEKDIPNLKQILSEIPKQRYKEMQATVRQIQRHFLLNEPSKRYDVLHMILHSVWLRRLNKKIIT